uniref:Par-6 family cell polarity regulator gamma n=1 Tax=Felis catus TaxID=9685 RepID=A0ABI7VSY6_FELCA
MNRSFHKSQTLRFYDCSAVEVKSKFGAEFRRFSLDRQKPGKFEDFYNLVVHTHHISNTDVTIGYADVHGDLLPINNDDNFCKAVSSANPLLRVFIQKREFFDNCMRRVKLLPRGRPLAQRLQLVSQWCH